MSRRRIHFDVEDLVRRNTSGKCFICEFLRGNPDYQHITVLETPHAVAFLNRFPTVFGSLIVAPKEHREAVTWDFTEEEYLQLQRLIYRVAEGIRAVLSPERLYLVSLGSQAANSHVHWHLAPLPAGVPLRQQQYYALMHENGIVESTDEELAAYARELAQVTKSAV